MISLITRKSRGPVRSGLVPLAAIALITACSACYFIPMWKAQPTWEGLPRAAVRRVSFDACLTASGVAQCPQQTVVKCQLENLRIRSRGGAFLAGRSTTGPLAAMGSARAIPIPVRTRPIEFSPSWRNISNRNEDSKTYEAEFNLRSRYVSRAFATFAIAIVAAPTVGSAAGPPPLERVQTIELKGPVGGLDHLALDAKRGRLFVANTVNGTLDVVDLKAGKLLKQVPGQGGIRGIDYDSGSDRVFVGNGNGGICNVFDGQSYELLKSIPLGDDADNVRYNPRTNRVYVVHADKELSVIDAKDYSVRQPIALPTSLGAFKLEWSRPRMYANAKNEGVIAIDTEQDKIIGRFSVAPAGATPPIAIDEPNRRLFIGCRKNPSLVVMDSDTGKILASVPIPGDVDDLSFDARRRPDLRLVRRGCNRRDPPDRCGPL